MKAISRKIKGKINVDESCQETNFRPIKTRLQFTSKFQKAISCRKIIKITGEDLKHTSYTTGILNILSVGNVLINLVSQLSVHVLSNIPQLFLSHSTYKKCVHTLFSVKTNAKFWILKIVFSRPRNLKSTHLPAGCLMHCFAWTRLL